MAGEPPRRDAVARSSHLLESTMSTTALAALGILLVLVAIPFGLMLAPLIIGVIIVAVSFRRLGAALEPAVGAVA